MRKLPAVWSGFAALCLLASSPAANAQTITLATPGERLETLVPKLAQQSGYRLAIDPRVKNEVLALRLAEAPADQALAHIATATGLQWTQAQGVFTLSRTPQAESAANARFVAWTAALLAPALRANQPVPLDPGPNVQSPREVFSPQLIRSARQNILAALPPQIIQNQSIGTRTVYSNRPNRSQRLLPTSALAPANWAVQTFNNRLAQAIRLTPAPPQNQPPRQGNRDRTPTLDASRQAVKLVLVVERPRADVFNLTAALVDAQGRYVNVDGGPLSLAGPPDQNPTSQPLPIVEPTPAEQDLHSLLRRVGAGSQIFIAGREVAFSEGVLRIDGQPVRPDSIGQIAQEALQQPHVPDPFAKGDVRTLLLAPADSEPLALVAGARLLRSVPEGRQFVAALPDDLAVPLLRQDKPDLAAAIADPVFGLEAKTEGEFLILAPRSHLYAWNTRRDRAAAQNLFKAFAGDNPALDLKTQAAYARTTHRWFRDDSWDARATAALFGRNFARRLQEFNPPNNEGLLLWSTLADRPNVPDTFEEGIERLGRAWLENMLFNSPQAPSRADPSVRPRRGRSENVTERTEFLPGGVPLGGRVIARREPGLRLYARDSRTGRTEVFDTNTLAFSLAALRSGARLDRVNFDPNAFDQWAVAEQQEWDFDIIWPDGTLLRREAEGYVPRTGFGPYSSLPANVRQTIDANVERIAQSLLERQQNRRPNNPPPP